MKSSSLTDRKPTTAMPTSANGKIDRNVDSVIDPASGPPPVSPNRSWTAQRHAEHAATVRPAPRDDP